MRFAMESVHPVHGTVQMEDSFWNPKLQTFFKVTLEDTLDKMEKDGTLENYKDVAAGRLHTHRGNPWHDGLLMETIRGASDYLKRGEKSEALIKRIDGYVELFEKAQLAGQADGYLSTYTMLERPHQRFGENGGDILWQHDLYNHGCLFEAGVHYYLATGKTKLLSLAVRSANYLAGFIGDCEGKKWIVPAHELPSYALIELIELFTDEPELQKSMGMSVDIQSWKTLVHFWIHGRGHHEKRTNHPQYMGEYSQDHAPVEAQVQAVGHAVRATLFYTGVTRLAMLEGDSALLEDSLRLWKNVEERKLHINGGIGATHFEEKFGIDYDLTNSAYLETCATVGWIFWAESLNRATGDARFFQQIERALYNLMLSSVTLQGDSYFYRNPLTSEGKDHHWAWHGCPCCPPMFHKIFGMFDCFVYAADDEGEGLFVNLLVGTKVEAELATGKVILHTTTKLPWDFEYALEVEQASAPFTLHIRLPYWADSPVFTHNGIPVKPEQKNGYALFKVQAGDTIVLSGSMPVVRMEAHPYVRCDRELVAVTRGPLVYCFEAVDNHGEVNFTLPEKPVFTTQDHPELLGGITTVHVRDTQGVLRTAVPLYAWDNRLAGAMNVWIRQSGKPDTWDSTGWEHRLYRRYQEPQT